MNASQWAILVGSVRSAEDDELHALGRVIVDELAKRDALSTSPADRPIPYALSEKVYGQRSIDDVT